MCFVLTNVYAAICICAVQMTCLCKMQCLAVISLSSKHGHSPSLRIMHLQRDTMLNDNNVGKTMINHPQFHHKCVVYTVNHSQMGVLLLYPHYWVAYSITFRSVISFCSLGRRQMGCKWCSVLCRGFGASHRSSQLILQEILQNSWATLNIRNISTQYIEDCNCK